MKLMFAENLKLAREVIGYSKDYVAEKLGIPVEEYDGYETGANYPELRLVMKMAELLSVTFNDLYGRDIGEEPLSLAEARANYGRKIEGLTVEDYFAMGDCSDYELIEGRLVQRNTHSFEHQRLVLRFAMTMEEFLSKHCSKCVVVPAPFSVVLEEKNGKDTVVQPDISVICRLELIKNGAYYGAPDIVVEVISPSNEKYDTFTKLELYKYYGVGEYWIVNPITEKVILFDIEAGSSTVVGSFKSTISSHRIKGFTLCIADILR